MASNENKISHPATGNKGQHLARAGSQVARWLHRLVRAQSVEEELARAIGHPSFELYSAHRPR